jgi:hypothetical protein
MNGTVWRGYLFSQASKTALGLSARTLPEQGRSHRHHDDRCPQRRRGAIRGSVPFVDGTPCNGTGVSGFLAGEDYR